MIFFDIHCTNPSKSHKFIQYLIINSKTVWNSGPSIFSSSGPDPAHLLRPNLPFCGRFPGGRCTALVGRDTALSVGFPGGRCTALVGRDMALVGRDITRSQAMDLPQGWLVGAVLSSWDGFFKDEFTNKNVAFAFLEMTCWP